MKYGSELSRRSVPEWRAYNLDYNEIKVIIKQATSSSASSDSIERVYEALFDQYQSVSTKSHTIFSAFSDRTNQ